MAHHSPQGLEKAIEAIIGQPPAAVPENYGVDGPDPRLAAYPEREEQVTALLALAEAEGLAVVVRGSGTRDGFGAPLRRADLLVGTRRLSGVVEYEPADLTVTVRAGTTLAELQAVLGQHGQWLPLDPPGPGTSTIGGLVAAAMAGPRRLAYGAPRDLVLGMRVALTHGFAVRCGGKVVKNVAGYDLNKLLTGSMGSLGVITEVSLKVRPRPVASRTVVLPFPSLAAAAAAARAALHSDLLPAALELLNGPAAARLGLPGPYALLAALEETPRAVAYQTERLDQLGRQHGAVDRLDLEDDVEQALWTAYAAAGRQWSSAAVLKAAVPPGAVADLVRRAEAVSGAGLAVCIQAGAGTGVVRMHLILPPEPDPAAVGLTEAARAAVALAGTAEALGGSLVVEQAPLPFKAQVDIWGPAGPALALMREIKRRFDPGGILNPGRMIGGI